MRAPATSVEQEGVTPAVRWALAVAVEAAGVLLARGHCNKLRTGVIPLAVRFDVPRNVVFHGGTKAAVLHMSRLHYLMLT